MNTRISAGKAAVLLAIVCASAALVWADELDLHAKLGEPIKIQLKNVTILEALEKIGQKAGVEFVLSDEAEWKLPQGKATRLSVTMDGSLADSMTEMLNAFFMRYAVGDEQVAVYPRPELEHVLGRPTAKQLELLKTIYTKPIEVYFAQELQRTVNESLGQKVLILPIDVHAQLENLLRKLVGLEPIQIPVSTGRPRPTRYAPTRLEAPEQEPDEPEPTEFHLPTPVTLVQLFSQVGIERSDPMATTWYISGVDLPGQTPEIRVVSDHVFANLKYNQKVDVSYRDRSADKIFKDLAGRAGARFIAKPGSDLSEYGLSVSMQNTTIYQAILNVADMVGATCEVRGSEIYLAGPGRPKDQPQESEKGKNQGKSAGDTYVGKISIPMEGGKYYIEFMLREKDLTDELKKMWNEKMKEVLTVPTLFDIPAEQPEKE